MNHSILHSLALVFALTGALGAQETAARFFDRVSERYKLIEDYSADLTITKGEVVQSAKLLYKAPNLLRLDFTDPEGMVMVLDGELLQIWSPTHKVTFSQSVLRSPQAGVAGIVSSRGLELLKTQYTISYLTSPDPTPLQPDSSEQVVKLKLAWKSNTEGFRRLELSVNQDLRIRRAMGVTTTGESITFDFVNIALNRGIPDVRFNYESPPIGNTMENFLFDPES